MMDSMSNTVDVLVGDDMELLKDFTEDVNNQQMSIHAYTLYVTGLVGNLMKRIKELKKDKTCDGCIHYNQLTMSHCNIYGQCSRMPYLKDLYETT